MSVSTEFFLFSSYSPYNPPHPTKKQKILSVVLISAEIKTYLNASVSFTLLFNHRIINASYLVVLVFANINIHTHTHTCTHVLFSYKSTFCFCSGFMSHLFIYLTEVLTTSVCFLHLQSRKLWAALVKPVPNNSRVLLPSPSFLS